MARKPPQFSFLFLLLTMSVFCGICAALYYASRVPAVVNDFYALLGKAPPGSEGPGRGLQMAFVMFTYSAPLLMAGTLSIIYSIWKRIAARR